LLATAIACGVVRRPPRTGSDRAERSDPSRARARGPDKWTDYYLNLIYD
jgi:hypothetical protein